MYTKTSFLLLLFFMGYFMATAQVITLEENKPAIENGVEYGYIIKNEQLKSAKGEEYSRYEITLYMSNKTGCTKLYADRSNSFSASETGNLLATFNCTNANGKRLTSKSGNIRAKDFYLNVKRTADGKEINERVKAGFIFRNGETINYTIIVLVPKGERPVMQAVANYLPELQ